MSTPLQIEESQAAAALNVRRKRRDPLQRTRRSVNMTIGITGRYCHAILRICSFFGGLVADIRERFPYYLADIVDAFKEWRCIAAVLFLFVSSVANAITFGSAYDIFRAYALQVYL